MAKKYGALQLLDTLATIDNANVMEYGEDLLYEHIRDLLDAHNEMTQDLVADFVEPTTQRVARFGANGVEGEMIEVDEYGTADVQKVSVTGYDIGWPLRAYQYSIGWTRRYFLLKTPADIAQDFIAAQTADIKNLKTQVLRALFRATNYSFIDRFVDSITLPVKALQNADSSAIPVDQYGNSFDGSTHTHLVGVADTSLAASDISALVDNVVEHGVNGGEVIIYINQAQEAAVRAFTSNFDGFQAPMLSPGPGSTADVVDGGRKDNPYQIDDKPIGIWDGFVTVWVKPWMPANYIVALLVGDGQRGEVLRMRTRATQGFGRFNILFEDENYPMRGQWMEREFGVGVWNRLGAAILYTGGETYTQPSI